MIYIETDKKTAAFHFSLEEFIVREYPFNEPVMMIWQTEKCAMLGNYQIAEAEINMSLAREAGVEIVRRASGGGTIFTDPGTFLISIIMPKSENDNLKKTAQEIIAEPIAQALNKMDIPAKIEGRNDITLNERKIVGMAQYLSCGRICTHASLLFDADLNLLAEILQVDEGKIHSKAIKSVRSRVTNIKEHMEKPCSTSEFMEKLKKSLMCDMQLREHSLTADVLKQVEEIRKEKYGNPKWTIGKSPKFTFQNSKRFEGGKIEVHLNVEKGVVKQCSIHGDFLGTVPICDLEECFVNKEFQYQVFYDLLDGICLQPFFGNITKE